MSIQAVAAAINIPSLPPATKLVLLLLANRHNGDTGLCCPRQERLAEEACMSERSLRSHIKTLEAGGYITRAIVRRGYGYPDVTHYSLQFLAETRPAKSDFRPEKHDNLDRQDLPPADLDRKKTPVRPANMGELDRKPSSGPIEEQPEGNRKEPSRAMRIPDDWAPSAELERKAKVDLNFTDDQFDLAVSEFLDYWQAAKGAKAKKVSWDRTFQNNLNTLSARWRTETQRRRSATLHTIQPASDFTKHLDAWIINRVWPEALCGPAPNNPNTSVPLDQLRPLLAKLPGHDERKLTLAAVIRRLEQQSVPATPTDLLEGATP